MADFWSCDALHSFFSRTVSALGVFSKMIMFAVVFHTAYRQLPDQARHGESRVESSSRS